jgi:Peptidase A4 family
MPAHQDGADAGDMQIKKRNYATALPAVAGLAAALLLTACSSGASSHPAAGTTTSPARAPTASTVTVSDQKDSNWAGYLVTSSATKKTSFSAVSGSWTEPAAHCQAGFPSHSAFWVGLGGYSGEHLEQTGTSADCSASGQATYYAWYELVPAAEVLVNITVQPGDRFTAHVAVSGDTVTVSISDLTRHATFSKRLQMSSPTVSSAEWIAEAPSRCLSSASRDCHILSLADFGSVTFTGASVSADGRTGSITSGLGQVSALTLEAAPGFGRLYATAAQANASPGSLSDHGTSFTVNWQRPEIQAPTVVVIVSGPIYN